MTDPLLDADADLAALLATARREALEAAARVVDALTAQARSVGDEQREHAWNYASRRIRALASASPAPREPTPLLTFGVHPSGPKSPESTAAGHLLDRPPAPSQQTGDAERRCLCRRYPLPINVGSQLQIDGLWHGTTFCDELAPPSPASQTTQDKDSP